jgi:hypothetical protein
MGAVPLVAGVPCSPLLEALGSRRVT